MIDVADIRFTQEHVWDSFNNNSSKGRGIVSLMKEILCGAKTPDDLPLIRVAWKQGAYWCVDNRRLFVYKHCQLGEIPVKVFHWKDNKEFELKFKNGLATRSISGEGRRIGVKMRCDEPFPISPVAEPSMCEIAVYLPEKEQAAHDAAIVALRTRREQEAKQRDQEAKFAACDAEKDALCNLLSLPRAPEAHAEEPEGGARDKPVSKKRVKQKKKKRQVAPDRGGSSGEEADTAEGRLAKKKKRKRSRAAAGEEDRGDAAAASEDLRAWAQEADLAPTRKKRRIAAAAAKGGAPAPAASEVAAKTAAPQAQARGAAAVRAGPQAGSQTRLTVAMGQEDSEDDAYNVEVTVM